MRVPPRHPVPGSARHRVGGHVAGPQAPGPLCGGQVERCSTGPVVLSLAGRGEPNKRLLLSQKGLGDPHPSPCGSVSVVSILGAQQKRETLDGFLN